MGRVCVINIPGLSPRLLELVRHLGMQSLGLSPHPMKPTFPALAPSVQASMTTGRPAGEHGVLGGSVYRREAGQISFCERSNTLLSCKRFWHHKGLPRSPNVAMVNWANALAGAAQEVVGCYVYQRCREAPAQLPLGLYDQLVEVLGPPAGHTDPDAPTASWRASAWLAEAAREVWTDHHPDLLWVTLPGLDMDLVRHGMDYPAFETLIELDKLAMMLVETVSDSRGTAMVVSDGPMVAVRRVARPNYLLARAGLVKLCGCPLGPTIDLRGSSAFVLADHQVGRLFATDESIAAEAAAIVAEDPAIGLVSLAQPLVGAGPGLERAGELFVQAAPDAWCTYAWWGPEDPPPTTASSLDLSAKCGYDPCQLLGAGETGINVDPHAVRASRGLLHTGERDQGVLTCTCRLDLDIPAAATDLPGLIGKLLFD